MFATAGSAAFTFAALALALLAEALDLTALIALQILASTGLSLVLLIGVEIVKAVGARRRPAAPSTERRP